jgi:hypothetical protein
LQSKKELAAVLEFAIGMCREEARSPELREMVETFVPVLVSNLQDFKEDDRIGVLIGLLQDFPKEFCDLSSSALRRLQLPKSTIETMISQLEPLYLAGEGVQVVRLLTEVLKERRKGKMQLENEEEALSLACDILKTWGSRALDDR